MINAICLSVILSVSSFCEHVNSGTHLQLSTKRGRHGQGATHLHHLHLLYGADSR